MTRKGRQLEIPEKAYQEIIEKTDIVTVVRRYVKLRRRGNVFRGRCPFCPDPGRSLVVSRRKRSFHCLSDCWGGDVIAFLSKQPGIESWQEDARILAKEAGVKL